MRKTATDSAGNKITVGDALSTTPYRVLVVKIHDDIIYLGREGWQNRMLPGDTEDSMLTKITQKEMTNSFWVKQ